jgi:high frequency lysogenization protein
MNSSLMNRTIAFAGLAQSIQIVQDIAWKGKSNSNDFKPLLASLLSINASSTAAIYNGSFELTSGLRTLKNYLTLLNRAPNPDFFQLANNLIRLQKQIEKNPSLLTPLTQAIQTLSKQLIPSIEPNTPYFDALQDESFYNEIIHLADKIYIQNISTLPYRIQVKGEPNYLKMNKHQKTIRAALLCAIRSIFLWRQLGGSRWHFFYQKKEMLSCIHLLLKQPQQ